MAAVIAVSDGNAAGIEEGEGCVEGGEARGITDRVAIEEGSEYGFEAGRVGRRETGVDVGGWIEVGLHEDCELEKGESPISRTYGVNISRWD